MLPLQVITVFLVAVAMSLALAHALEYPGKMRLNRESHIATQTIYYPGFTIGGFGEALGVLATLALVLLTPQGTAPFWWSLAGFLAVAGMQAVFWTVTQPVNRHWTANLRMSSGGRQFFGVGEAVRSSGSAPVGPVGTLERSMGAFPHCQGCAGNYQPDLRNGRPRALPA